MLDYGIVGNCKTCALVSKKGSVEWMCFPRFDSPSVFAKILDRKKGGSFEIIPKGNYKARQEYSEGGNILETHFISKNAGFKVIDFFPRYRKLLPGKRKGIFRQNRLIRIIEPTKGKPVIRVKYDPMPNYAREGAKTRIRKGNLLTRNRKEEISLISNVDYGKIVDSSYFEIDRKKYFIVGAKDNADDFSVTKCMKLLAWTKRYWKRWVSSLELPEMNREIITRSALVLKLLTFSETGAIIAAPTTSIPEEPGTSRTFDYRFCWVRDAAFTVDALKKIGRNYEAKKLMEFIFDNTLRKKEKLRLMYGISGETSLEEKELPHLGGFMGSRPVRIGNAAYSQKQNDIYGSIIDIMYLYYVYYEYEEKMKPRFWKMLKYLVKEISEHWNEPDKGIWEFRDSHRHFTYSKLMCYVGVERAVRIAQFYERNDLAEKWARLMDAIREDILEKGWNRKARAFTIHYGSNELDAAALRMSYHEFLPPDDPRIISTIRKIYSKLRKGALVQRYKVRDDFGKSKSAFTICSFWLVDALYYIGERKKAGKMFKKLMGYSNHLGLFSEDIDTRTGKLAGNFPQAYTHLALINSAILLSEWSAKRKKLDHQGIFRGKQLF